MSESEFLRRYGSGCYRLMPIFDPVWIDYSDWNRADEPLEIALPGAVIWVYDPLRDYLAQLGDA